MLKINYLEIKEETARELFEKVMALNHEYEITDIIAFQDLADFYALLKDEQKERFVSEALPKYCAEMDRWETIFALYYSIGEQEKEEFIALLIENAEKPDSLYRLNEFFKVAAMKILDEEKNGSATKRVFLKYLEGKK